MLCGRWKLRKKTFAGNPDRIKRLLTGEEETLYMLHYI